MSFVIVVVACISAPLFFVLGYVMGLNEPCQFCRPPYDDSENQVGPGTGE